MLDPARLAEAFALGQPQGPLTPVPGAWSNRLWRLQTEQGRCAIKELRGPLAAVGEWIQRLRVAMTVERAAWTAGTIPMAEPMAAVGGGGWLAEVATTSGQGATARCHRWVPGTPATAVAPSPAMAADVGRSLAAIHALGLTAPETTATGLVPLSPAAWRQTVTQAHRAGLAWAGKLAALTPVVEKLGAPVLPMLCVHDTRIPWDEVYVDNVPVLTPGRLLALLRSLPAHMDEVGVMLLAEHARHQLHPAT